MQTYISKGVKMLSEGLAGLLRAIHLPLEIYIILASAYVLAPAILYPLFAKRIKRKLDSTPDTKNNTASFIIVTPAHNEGKCIENLIRSISDQSYPRDKFTHIVIADNCSDDTSDKSRTLGAEVLDRKTSAPSDKTQALRFVSERMVKDQKRADYVVVIDADCTLPETFLTALASAISLNPAGAYQTYRRVSNAAESSLSAMDAAAEELRQVINLGVKDCLGFDAHLHGNGTAYRMDLFHACAQARQEPFADDKAWKATLTEMGEHIKWVANAHVDYAAVTHSDNFQNQRKRWITGQVEMIKSYSMRMMGLGISRGDKSAIEFGLSMLQLPRAILFVAAVYLFAASLIVPTIITGHSLLYLCLSGGLVCFGFIGYAIGEIPLHPKKLISTGIRAITGVASSTIAVLLGKKTSSWASLREE